MNSGILNWRMSLDCQNCGKGNFPSRNKLFAHLKVCLIHRNPEKVNIIADEEFFKSNEAYIYVTGGRIRGKTLNCVERYSCEKNTWESLPSLSEHRGSHGSAVVGQTLYVLGGGGLHSNLSSIEKLDCKTNKWEISMVQEHMLSFRHALGIINMGKDIFAIGGWVDGSYCSPQVEKYDTQTNTWMECANFPTPRRLFGITSLDEKIYTFGGNCGDGIWNSDVLEIYDVLTDSWSKGKSVPIAGQTSAATIDSYIFVAIHGHHIVRYSPLEDDYITISFELPFRNWFCFDVSAINGRLYFHGGNIDGVWSNVLWKYDPFDNTWIELAKMKKSRRRCSAAVVAWPKIQ